MAEKFDPTHADRLENPERLVELPPANLVELLRLAGAETIVDFGAGTGMYSMALAPASRSGASSPSTNSRSSSTACAPSSRGSRPSTTCSLSSPRAGGRRSTTG